MGKGIDDVQFKECLAKAKIKKFIPAKKLVTKELKSAQDDLKVARDSFNGGNYKWATIQAYYSMFHAARALIYSKGYRERSHYCLIVAIKALFVTEGLLDIILVEAIQTAKILRENADYENEFSREGSQSLLDKAQELLNRTKEILEKTK
jgi:uncharacterized protein (UPF0332 family)